MARIPLITTSRASLSVRLAYFFTRRSMAKLAQATPEQMLEPVQIYAHVPRLLRGYSRVEQATASLRLLDHRSRALAELKTATVVQCEYCIDLGSRVARTWGVSDAELLALPHYTDSDLFDDRDKTVLDYAVAMTRTPADVPEQLFTHLHDYFSDPQLVELTHIIALENHRSRFNHAFGVGAAGFSDGMVCALPVTTSSQPRAHDNRFAFDPSQGQSSSSPVDTSVDPS